MEDSKLGKIFKDYWRLKEIVQKLLPRKSLLEETKKAEALIREYGRKENLKEFNFESSSFLSYGRERILPQDVIYNFLEVSIRAAHCPMPLNADMLQNASTDGCQYRCKYCLPAGTKILMANGSEKRIERVRLGESVVAYNEGSKKIEYCEVLDRMKRPSEELICIHTNKEVLKLTGEHPVYTKRGWVKAVDLSQDDDVLVWPRFDGGPRWKKLVNISKEKPECEYVYNLEVKNNNNYFANNVLVHNCFVSSYSSSLYTAFYDNWRELGLRYCNEKHFLTEMDKYMRFRNSKPFDSASDIQNAFHIGIPVRLGIRSENFVPAEKKLRASYAMLKFLKDNEYPVMINTKSNMLQSEEYLRVLADNKAKSAVHMTIISSDEALLRELEPFAPTFKKRLASCKALIDAGIRVVARIEPFMCFINDSKEKVDDYIGKLKEAGIRNITLDTYSYSASAPGLRKNFENIGWDFDRMFSVTAECQWLGSLLLTYFIRYLRSNGFSCSTFDYGSAMENDQNICCEVGDWFDKGFSHGNTIMAVRYIKSRQGEPVTWNEYEKYVEANGGFLSPTWKREVQKAWNLIGTVAQVAYFPMWGTGIKTVGFDDTLNTIWLWDKQFDYREELLQNLIT